MNAVVIVWFEPSDEDFKNYISLINHFDYIIVIDNSKEDNSSRVFDSEKIFYFPQRRNLGIAAAENIGFNKALEFGCRYLLFMCQDSSFNTNEIKKHLKNSISFLEKNPHASVVASRATIQDKEMLSSNSIVEVDSVIDTGSIFSLDKWSKTLGFKEDYFIDLVDHELCYQLKKLNFKVYVNLDVEMNHKLGQTKNFSFFGRSFISTGHNALRQYYYARNVLFLRNSYPEFSKPKKIFIKETIIKLLSFFYEDKTFKKLFGFSLGCIDFYRGKLGSLEGRRFFKYLRS